MAIKVKEEGKKNKRTKMKEAYLLQEGIPLVQPIIQFISKIVQFANGSNEPGTPTRKGNPKGNQRERTDVALRACSWDHASTNHISRLARKKEKKWWG